MYEPGAGNQKFLKWHYKNLSYHVNLMQQQAPASHQPGIQHASAADMAADLRQAMQQTSQNTRKVGICLKPLENVQ